MATSTTNYGFLKPDPSEVVNVQTQINDNLDDIDNELGRVSFHPVVRARQETVQSIPHETWTSFLCGVDDFDTHLMHDVVSNTSRFVCPATWGGYYLCSGNAWVAADVDGVRFTRWAKNGTVIDNTGLELSPTPSSALWGGPATTVLVNLSPGDYVELQVWQTSGGGALDTAVGTGNETGSFVSIKWDRPL